MARDPEFGKRLRQAKREWEQRHDRTLPQTELADRVREVAGSDGLSAQAVGDWLNKGTEPRSLALLKAVADVLEVSVAWLAFGDDLTPAQQRGAQEFEKSLGHVQPRGEPQSKKADTPIPVRRKGSSTG